MVDEGNRPEEGKRQGVPHEEPSRPWPWLDFLALTLALYRVLLPLLAGLLGLVVLIYLLLLVRAR